MGAPVAMEPHRRLPGSHSATENTGDQFKLAEGTMLHKVPLQGVEPFHNGDRVEAKYRGRGKWLPAEFLRKSHKLGCYTLLYDHSPTSSGTERTITTEKEHVRSQLRPSKYFYEHGEMYNITGSSRWEPCDVIRCQLGKIAEAILEAQAVEGHRKNYNVHCATCRGAKYLKCHRRGLHAFHLSPRCQHLRSSIYPNIYDPKRKSFQKGGCALKCTECDGTGTLTGSASFGTLKDTYLREVAKREGNPCECDEGWVLKSNR